MVQAEDGGAWVNARNIGSRFNVMVVGLGPRGRALYSNPASDEPILMTYCRCAAVLRG